LEILAHDRPFSRAAQIFVFKSFEYIELW
jgi:hypothetical protein